MRFPTPLVPATLVRRYKRFLADVVLPDGREVTVHVANSGAMLGLMTPGARVWLADKAGAGRKLPFGWELVEADFGAGPELVGVNTMHPNALVADAIASGLVPELSGYARMRREVKYGVNSRIDILLEDEARPPCFVEVKNVHLMRAPGVAEFPDCATARGAKHLGELAAEVKAGHRAVMVYLSQIASAQEIRLARDLDPAYGRAFDLAHAAGVEAIGLVCRIDAEGIEVERTIPMLG
ncbi:sugar fermentation stimulation protein [Azorhizobium oxalatiphilum]|uniref:Sugar fermentation stimulation protein homolog n=1 Tax=Azorhizobium oxalatiphilum TaxID=980631 RepID=A0A917CI70_9HYPH|nr:DNA/RNA nuclease SfsA [Azorhizobium oxalatiphilum]GGF89186.1 sugar fermentation stimulation protein [Azorhizobium oxalatiphilum]